MFEIVPYPCGGVGGQGEPASGEDGVCMEMKPSYKQTEAGVIPDDWLHLSLGRVSKLQRGFDLPHRSREKGEIPIITSSGFGEYHSESRVQGPGVVTGRYGTIGEVFYIQENFWPLNTTLYVKDFYGNDPLYILYLLRRIDFHTHSGKSGVPGINRNDLHEIVVALPPTRTEQEAIAKALSDADALIEALDQVITKKRQIKQGAMQELLTGKRRLPGFSGEWVDVKLGDVADPLQGWSFTGGPFGSNLKSSDYTNDGVRIIQLQNIGDGEFQADSAVFTTTEKADELISCNIYPGEIILSKMGDPVARACLIPALHDRYLMCSDGIRLAVDKRRFNTFFVFAQINAPDFRARANNAGTGSTRKRIGLTELRSITLSCPEVAEQTAIATVLSDMDTELAALESRLAKARQIKQGMMQELLTGRIRLL